VAVTTTEVNSAVPSPSALDGTAISQNKRAESNIAVGPCLINASLPHLWFFCAVLYRVSPRYVSQCNHSQALKYGGFLPLRWDLSKSSHNHGLNGARIALIVAASVAAAGAKDVRTDISVSATVLAVAKIELQSAPIDLQISAADVRRGFIDVEQPTRIIVRSNSRSGFALEVLTVVPLLSSMIVQGLDSDLSLGADGGTIVQRWQKPQAVMLSLKFRFALAPDLSAGDYPWPVRLAVRPLESI
jgi:hypothetical protein